jgi:hypothetical protein
MTGKTILRFFNKTQTSKQARRSIVKPFTHLSVLKHRNKPVRRRTDAINMARTLLRTVNADTALDAADACLQVPRDIYVCVPELQARPAMLKCPRTQVIESGQVVGARTCCPMCKSNKFVMYKNFRTRKMWDFECVSLVIDLRCECRNPECAGYQSELSKALQNANISSSSSAAANSFAKSNPKIRYSFSNIDERLLELYPAAISTKYPFFSRTRGFISLRLRRDFYCAESEATIYARMEARYKDHYLSNNVQDYTEIVQEHGGKHGYFPPVSQIVPNYLKPLSPSTLKSIQDAFWIQDREGCVRTMMEVSAELSMTTDYTFEIARLVDGCGAALIILNGEQVPMFFGFCEKEDGKSLEFALALLMERFERLGVNPPKAVVDDRCCNCQLQTANVKQGPYVSVLRCARCGHKDAFHFVKLGTELLCPANKKSMAAPRALLVKQLQQLVWEPRIDVGDLVKLYNDTVQLLDAGLDSLSVDVCVLDELRVVRHVIASKDGKVNRNINTSRAAINSIRERSTYNKNMRRRRSTPASQANKCAALIERLRNPKNDVDERMASTMRKRTAYSRGFLEFLERAYYHLTRGCLQTGLKFDEEYIAIAPKKDAKCQLFEFAPRSQQSSLEALNRALGDCTRGLSSMRDGSVEQKAFITLMHRSHSRRKKLGQDLPDKPFDFLFATQQELIDELWPGSAKGKSRRGFDLEVPLEPMGLDFNKALLSSTSAQLVAKVKQGAGTSRARSNDMITGDPSSSSSSDLVGMASGDKAGPVGLGKPVGWGSGEKAHPVVPVFPAPRGLDAVSAAAAADMGTGINSSDTAAGGADSKEKKRKWNPLDAPFHQPSRPMSVSAMSSSYPHEEWTDTEKSWAVVRLMHAGASLKSLESVLEDWAKKALDPNDTNFVLHRLPQLSELKAFSADIGNKMDVDSLTESASVSGASSVLSRKKRKKYRFHSDDAKKDDSGYLVFPLKMDELQKMEQRRKKAYCRAIGVKGKSGPVLMNRLRERIESAGEMGLARPDTPPDGIVWSAWYFDIQ